MIETSRIARPLTGEEVRLVAERHFPGQKIARFTALKGGLFNNTVRIDFENAGSVVLRAGPIRPDLLLPFELHLMAAEAEVDRLCAAAGVPCSEVLALDTDKTLLGRDYMVVRCIDSLPLCDPAVPAEAKPALYRQTGQLTARFHRITGPAFGRVYDVTHGNGCAAWADALLREFGELRECLLSAHVMEAAALDEIGAAFAENRALFAVEKPALIHTDLWEGNILVRQNAESWEVAAIIDGDRAYFGDPDYDFATPWMINPDFLAGYGETPADTPARRKKLLFYRLLCCLTEAYIWPVEYQNEQAGLEKQQEVASCLREIQSM